MDPHSVKQLLLQNRSSDPFDPSWWNKGPHLQTVWGSLFRVPPKLPFDKEKLRTPDADFLNLHYVRGAEDAPVAVLLHGLEGSVKSHYILGTVERLAARGWTAVAMEFRGCGGEMNRALRMYHMGETSDLDFVVETLATRFPRSRLYAVGFSLGGNVLAKWLGERGAFARVSGAAIVSAPYDLKRSSEHFERALRGFYSKRFLKTLVHKVVEKEKQYPGSLDVEAVRRVRSLRHFDEVATAPLHGFENALDYYEKCSCGQYMDRIRVPSLLLSSEDDPFFDPSTLPREAAERSPWLAPEFTERGGHLGFVRGPMPTMADYWAEERVADFLEQLDRLLTEMGR